MAVIQWRTEKRRLKDLVEWEKNPRRLTEKQAKHLGESLEKFGYVEEIVLNADGKSMIGGHQRRRILLVQALLKPNAEVDVRIPSRQLTPDEAEELAIRLNLNIGEWDDERLANEFDSEKLLEWGFEPFQLGGLDEPSARLGAGGASSDFEGGRMVTLYLTVDTLAEFEKITDRLAKTYKTDNVSDTVMAALRKAK